MKSPFGWFCRLVLLKTVVAGVVLAAPSQLRGQTRILTHEPDNFLKRLADSFIDARNDSDPESRLGTLATLMAGSEGPKHGTSEFLGDLLDLGGQFEPAAVYSVAGGRAVHIIGRESKTGEWMRYQLGLDPQRPLRIGMIAQTPSSEPAKLPPGTLDTEDVRRFMADFIHRQERETGFSGAVLAWHSGEVVLSEHVGLANDQSGRPITEQTPMNMASGSKMFTAVLIGMAVERGLLSWHSTVDMLVPSLATKEWASQVSVLDLLSHRSGLPDFWTEEFEKSVESVHTLVDFIPFFTDQSLEFEPRSDASYSNTNFIVLGLILESIEGLTYPEILTRDVLLPLGMLNTSLGAGPSSAETYEPAAPGEWSRVLFRMPPASAGGAYSTVDDLLKCGRALVAGELVSSETLEFMTTVHSDLGAAYRYGAGFGLAGPDWSHFGHGGRGPGVSFNFRVYPKTDTIVILMSNRSGSAFLDIWMNIEQLVDRW